MFTEVVGRFKIAEDSEKKKVKNMEVTSTFQEGTERKMHIENEK
jgi:hypothetical protein